MSYFLFRILELQKDRFFDNLKEKYWNHSAKGECPDSNDSEGITLESLGNVHLEYVNITSGLYSTVHNYLNDQ